MAIPHNELIERFKEKKPAKALLAQFAENPAWRIDFNGFRKELLNLHVARPIKSMNLRKTRQIDNVINANAVDQGTRSRLVEILLTCRTIHNEITRQLEYVKEMLLIKYRSSLASIRSKADKENFIYYGVFGPIYKFLTDIEQLEEEIQLVIEDIDKASYNISRLVTLVEIQFGHNGREKTIGG